MGTASNVIVGQAAIYTAPFAGTPLVPAAQPAMTSTTGSWTPASPWVLQGFTEDGLTLDFQRKIQEIRVEEQSTPVLVTSDSIDFQAIFTLAEDTLANMKLAYGGGTIGSIVGSAGIAPQSTLNLSDSLDQLSFAAVGANAYGYQTLVYIPAVFSAGKVSTKWRRAAAPRTYMVTLTTVSAPSAILIAEITGTHA